MKLILFDLGNTLESGGVLLPEARETLEAVTALAAGAGPTAALGLLSDFTMPAGPADIAGIQAEYYALLDDLGIRHFFEPVPERVTLSTEVGVSKPDVAMFRTAAAKVSPGLEFQDVLFITENAGHVHAARLLGLAAVHLRGPGQAAGEVESLPGLVPLVKAFLADAEPTVLEAGPDIRDAVMERILAADAAWTRLGNVLVQWRPAVRQGVLDPDGGTGFPLRTFRPEHRLHLVTQLGRTFQNDHPGVRVVVDKGRYLVVDLGSGALAPREGAGGDCYEIRPLPAGAVVFDEIPAAPGAGAQKSALAAALSRERFEDDVDRLASLRTRHSASADFRGALEWAKGRLDDLGFATSVQDVPVPGGSTRNLVADRPGDATDRHVVLLTGHLDSVNTGGGAAAPAPGADDNASGSAGVLAIAAALAGRPARHDLRFVLFGGEEQGLFGSRHYVGALSGSGRTRISAVVNMDMIACRNSSVPTVLLEGASASQSLVDGLALIARTHTSLAVQTSLNPYNSDHVPFLDAGIPAVLTIEGTDSANHRIHTAQDTFETLDISLAMEILRMNTLFAAQALGMDPQERTL